MLQQKLEEKNDKNYGGEIIMEDATNKIIDNSKKKGKEIKIKYSKNK